MADLQKNLECPITATLELIGGKWKPIILYYLTSGDLDELGIRSNAEIVDVSDKNQQFLQREIIGRQTPYVALVRNHKLEGLVDRQMLMQRVAQIALL